MFLNMNRIFTKILILPVLIFGAFLIFCSNIYAAKVVSSIVDSPDPYIAKEGSALQSATIKLDSAPASNVTVTLKGKYGINDASAQFTFSQTSFLFTPTNWSTPQSFQWKPTDDSTPESFDYWTIEYYQTSTDTASDSAANPGMTAVTRVEIQDNDLRHTTNPASLSLAETGGTSSVGVKMNADTPFQKSTITISTNTLVYQLVPHL